MRFLLISIIGLSTALQSGAAPIANTNVTDRDWQPVRLGGPTNSSDFLIGPSKPLGVIRLSTPVC